MARALGHGRVELPLVGQGTGQGQPAVGVARMAREPLPTAGDGVRRSPRPPIELGELGERPSEVGSRASRSSWRRMALACAESSVGRRTSSDSWRRGARHRHRAAGVRAPRGRPARRRAGNAVLHPEGADLGREHERHLAVLRLLVAGHGGQHGVDVDARSLDRQAQDARGGAPGGPPSRSEASPSRRASRASPTIPRATASPCVQRPYRWPPPGRGRGYDRSSARPADRPRVRRARRPSP